jgi:uncharacterized membrane protein YraQ (UPF0718 family)
MSNFFWHVWQSLVMAAAMAWQVGWSLVLGFALSGVIQAVVSREKMRAQLGHAGLREIALATAYGAASSSCSYAAAALSKTLFKKGAALTPSLAFLFSSTNLVVELGVILYLLMGWQFALAEWVGGVVLVAIMAGLVKLTYPKKLVEDARVHVENATGHDHADEVAEGTNLWRKLRNPRTKVLVAQNVAMDWSMLRNDLILGFLIAGFIAVFVPTDVWKAVFLVGADPWIRTLLGAAIGALLAIVTFVCSIGNVPMAAVLWSAGISFSGALAFLYADLIVLPLLDVYRKYYGWRMAAYIFGVFFVTMVSSAIIMDLAFSILRLTPTLRPNVEGLVEHFSFNYTFWLNLVAAGGVLYFIYVNRSHPMKETDHC